MNDHLVYVHLQSLQGGGGKTWPKLANLPTKSSKFQVSTRPRICDSEMHEQTCFL